MSRRRRKPFQRYFTVAEANALVPELQKQILRLQAMLSRLREEHGEKAQQVLSLEQRNGRPPEWEPSPLVEAIHKAVEELHALGVVLRDVEDGIVDFPHLRNGREVFLCWKLGEERIRYWHELDTGFNARKPLTEE
ncbi:MAG: DUF2203 domain-containing protein [Fimbriimonadales bacterium]|nr:DUF2203 domain-containing protein [Fimbriimonadales bacterium]